MRHAEVESIPLIMNFFPEFSRKSLFSTFRLSCIENRQADTEMIDNFVSIKAGHSLLAEIFGFFNTHLFRSHNR